MDIGKSVRICMARDQITGKELAEKLGMREQSMYRLKNEKSTTGQRISQIAKVFGMKASEFIALGE